MQEDLFEGYEITYAVQYQRIALCFVFLAVCLHLDGPPPTNNLLKSHDRPKLTYFPNLGQAPLETGNQRLHAEGVYFRHQIGILIKQSD